MSILESEIDKRTEPHSIKCSETEQEHENGDDPKDNMLFVVIIGVKHKVLDFLAKGKKSEESEDDSNDKGGVELCVGM